MVVGNRGMLLIQGRFYVCRVLYDTFIVTIDEGGLSFRHWYSEAPQFKTQMFDGFQANLQRDEFGGERSRFDGLLTFAVPNDW